MKIEIHGDSDEYLDVSRRETHRRFIFTLISFLY